MTSPRGAITMYFLILGSRIRGRTGKISLPITGRGNHTSFRVGENIPESILENVPERTLERRAEPLLLGSFPWVSRRGRCRETKK
jgi:hypothetical protein